MTAYVPPGLTMTGKETNEKKTFPVTGASTNDAVCIDHGSIGE